MTHQLTDLRLWLETHTGEVMDAHAVEFSYALNSIPTGAIQLAPGTNFHTLQPSTVDRIIASLVEPLPVRLKLVADPGPQNVPDTIYNKGTYTLFDGYLQTAGNSVTSNSLSITGYLSHWLSDLTRGSAISASSHPANPIQFQFNAAIPDSADGGSQHYLPITVAQRHFTSANIANDLWGEAILPWFKDLAATDRINAPIFGRNDAPDARVQKALARFNGAKLPVRVDGADSVEIAYGIAEDISASVMTPNNNHFAAIATQTLWDKLVGDLSPIYHFAIVPGPTWAKIVPFVPGLRKIWNSGETGKLVTVLTRDIESSNKQDELIREIGGFGLCSVVGSLTGGVPPGDALPTDLKLGGVYKASDTGQIIIRRAPRWCEKAMLPGGVPITPDSTGPVPMAGEPDAGDAPAKTVKKTAKSAKAVLDRMAQAYYLAEVLRHRHLVIESPLRFDIAPGSNISVQAVTAGGDIQFLVGTVVRVGYSISVKPLHARTTYHLAHVRQQAENASDRYSTATHPIYSEIWAGDYLAKPE